MTEEMYVPIIRLLGDQEGVPLSIADLADRLGIAPDHEIGDGARYVLGAFRKAQYPLIDEVLEMAAKAVTKAA